MKKIPLTQNKFALVDDADYEYLMQWKWYAVKDKNTFYAARRMNGKMTMMHRLLLGLTDPKIEGEHQDGDGLNNQRRNLREATRSQNNQNKSKQRNNTSGYKGVGWNKAKQKWQAQIAYLKKKVHLGYYVEKKDAACAYNKAAIQYHGQYAHLNVGVCHG